MKTRIITALVALCVLIPVLIFSDTWLLPAGVAVCALIAVFEMSRCVGLHRSVLLTAPLYLCAAGFPVLLRLVRDQAWDVDLIYRSAFAALLAVTLYLFAAVTFSHGKYKLQDAAVLFLSCVYILFGFNAILFLHDFEPAGEYVYLTVFIGAWITDTFAYFCGMLFGRGGKHKLIPDVSPKKTVEGAIGGTVFCVICMTVYGLIVSNFVSDVRVSHFVIFIIGGLIAAVVAQIGDLCMSLIKRGYGIKDYGKIFPGHGGVLDRFDSILAVSSALMVYCSFFDFFRVV